MKLTIDIKEFYRSEANVYKAGAIWNEIADVVATREQKEKA